jgi:hypothetical protein
VSTTFGGEFADLDAARELRAVPSDLPESWQAVDLGDVIAGRVNAPEPVYLQRSDGQALLYAGRVNEIHSATEGGKTWLAMKACAEALEAGERVLILDFESEASEIVPRLQALDAPDLEELLSYIRPDDPITETLARSLAQPYAVVILDGVTEALSLLGLKSTLDTDVAAFHRMLPRPFADAGACVLLIDHVVKSKEGDTRFAIGSQHKLAGVTGASYELQGVRPFGRGIIGEAKLAVAKDRPGFIRGMAQGARNIATVTLDATQEHYELTLEPLGDKGGTDGNGLPRAAATVLSVLGTGVTQMYRSQIADAIAAGPWPQGYRDETISRALATLRDRGLADSAEHRWWKVVTDDGG